MAKKKTARTDFLDPAVEGSLTSYEQRDKLARMPKAKRNKAKRDAQRNRVMLDLPPQVQDALRKEADGEGVSMSSLAAFLLTEGLKRLRNDEINLEPHKREINSLRFKHGLAIEDLPG